MKYLESLNKQLGCLVAFIEHWFPWAIPLGMGMLFLEQQPLGTVIGWLCIIGAVFAAFVQLLRGLAWAFGRVIRSMES